MCSRLNIYDPASSIITFHHRMPVIPNPALAHPWLESDNTALCDLMAPLQNSPSHQSAHACDSE